MRDTTIQYLPRDNRLNRDCIINNLGVTWASFRVAVKKCKN